MPVKKTFAIAATAVASALSVVLLMVGTFIAPNTLFFTALAAYLTGYSINKCGLPYGFLQLVVCVLLDIFLNPDKLNWILYLCMAGYIFLSELMFRKWNHVRDEKKKYRVQLICNCILFNMIYIPLLLLFKNQFLFGRGIRAGIAVLWAAGQVGWIIFDRAYCVFFRTIREHRL